MNALLAYVNESDVRWDDRARLWAAPRWFRLWMRAATRLADGWLWLTLLAAPLASAGGWRLLAKGTLAVSATNALLVLLKRHFRRTRPCERCPHPLFAEVVPPDPFSVPSGHTMNAFAFASVVALGFPVLAPALLVVGVSVAASRVVLGMHYVSDVVVGSLLGTMVGVSTSALVG
jgi:undecaprenyl-diphosphatase